MFDDQPELARNAANFVPLSPMTFLRRAAEVHPDRTAVVHGHVRMTWGEVADRCRRLAAGLVRLGIVRNDTVAVIAPNTPALLEAHFGVPLAGAVLNALNTRLDPSSLGFIMEHSGTKLVLADSEFMPAIQAAIAGMGHRPRVIRIDDALGPQGVSGGEMTYEELLASGEGAEPLPLPRDEWDAISINYTSGTTGDPKGVVYHHRGAYLNAMGNVVTWELPRHPVYLWTLPMFHCNGWCFPWTVTLQAGTHVCLRRVEGNAILDAIEAHGVTHLCGAPIVMAMMADAAKARGTKLDRPVKMLTAGAAPPAAVIERLESTGIEVTHVYGLTEVYGPVTLCEPQADWAGKSPHELAMLKARQGVRYATLEGAYVADPKTLEPVPRDGETMGEIMMRGNTVARGYLKNPRATAESFAGGWFHTGDLAVMHPDGYMEIRDRSKDIIISGGENISSIEVEGVLYRHPAVLAAAVVAKPDEKWGETPCAFVELRQGMEATAEELTRFCREHMAGYKVPRTFIFGPLPRTSTGKVQKFVLRTQAKAPPQ